MLEVSKNILKDIYQPRSPSVRKYDFGILLVIGGSEFYSGSPALAALSAFRAGADMVRIAAPKRAADIIASISPNLAAYPLNEERITKKSLSILFSMTESAEDVSRERAAVVIGGGLGRTEETQKAVLEYLSQVSLPLVVDADAIYAAAKKPEILRNKPFLFTPHGYEFFILTGREIIGRPLKEQIKTVEEEARRLKTTILLKGQVDIISDGKETFLNKTHSPYMTTGGCGDTLAGICGALLARGKDPLTAAKAAAYINGRAGEICAKAKKDGLLATDLIEAIPEVISR
jgi:NAD(P)H-hydrate epimerase